MGRMTCLACCSLWLPMDEICWNCGCPYNEAMFTDPTGEQQDMALRKWFEENEGIWWEDNEGLWWEDNEGEPLDTN